MIDYCELVIRYGKKMPPTTLIFMEKDLKRYAERFSPPPPVKTEFVQSSAPIKDSDKHVP